MTTKKQQTVDSVFGNTEKGLKGEIPGPVFELIKKLAANVGKDQTEEDILELKTLYVDILNLPAVQLQKDPWQDACRSFYSRLSSRFSVAEGHHILYMPTSVQGKPVPTKGKFQVKTFGWVESQEPDFPLRGPAQVAWRAFHDEASARVVARQIQPYNIYDTTVALFGNSAVGELKDGLAAELFNDTKSAPVLANVAKDSEEWQDIDARVLGCFPVWSVKDVITRAEDNHFYRYHGDVNAPPEAATDENGSSGVSFRFGDMSLDIEEMKKYRGGMRVFGSSAHAKFANLPVGSRLDVLVSGYHGKKSQQPGATQYADPRLWSLVAAKCVLDLSLGMPAPPKPAGTPEPGKPVVVAPPAPAGSRKNFSWA